MEKKNELLKQGAKTNKNEITPEKKTVLQDVKIRILGAIDTPQKHTNGGNPSVVTPEKNVCGSSESGDIHSLLTRSSFKHRILYDIDESEVTNTLASRFP